MTQQQYLPELLTNLRAQLAAKQVSRDEAVKQITDRWDITQRGAEDLLDNGIRESVRSF